MAAFPTCAEIRVGGIEVFSEDIVIPEDGTYWAFADVQPDRNFDKSELVCYITESLEIVHQDVLSFSTSSAFGEALAAFDLDQVNGTITVGSSMHCRVRFSLAVEGDVGSGQGGFVYVSIGGGSTPGAQHYAIDGVSGWDTVYGEGRFSLGEGDVISLKIDHDISGGGAPDVFTSNRVNSPSMSWLSIECVEDNRGTPSMSLVVGDTLEDYRIIASGSGGIGGIFSATEGQFVSLQGDGAANSIHIFKIDGVNEWGTCSVGQIG